MSAPDLSAERRRHFLLALALALLLIAGLASYLTLYTRWISGTTAIPTFDQAAYVEKSWVIADRIAGHPLAAINPLTYLSEPHANRPPLMMALAAFVLGRSSDPASIATLWLITRLLILAGALALIAWRIKNGWWIPAAVLTILSAPGWLKVYPNLLMMDQTLEVTVLLALVCIAWDFSARTTRSAVAALAAFLLALMIKPAAAILFFPWFPGLLWQLVKHQLAGRRLLVYIIGVMILALLAVSPYGIAAAQLYALGTRGYWNFPASWDQKLGMITLIIPLWLIAAAAAARLLRVQFSTAASESASGLRWLLIPAIVLALWWYCFNALITFSCDPRIIPAAMAIAVTAACIYIARSWRSGFILMILAAGFFWVSLMVVTGHFPEQKFTPWLKPQPTIKEVGLRQIATALKNMDELRGKRLMIAGNDDFVEVAALRVALRMTPGYADFQVDSFPWGPEPDVADRLLSFDYVLTKKIRSRCAMVGDVYASLSAIERLIHDPGSPLHDHIEPLWSLPVSQPDLTDEVTLWRIDKNLSADTRNRAAAFVEIR